LIQGYLQASFYCIGNDTIYLDDESFLAGECAYYGYTCNLSENGASVALLYIDSEIAGQFALGTSLKLKLPNCDRPLSAIIVRSINSANPTLGIEFTEVENPDYCSAPENRYLVNLIYTTMTHWKQRKAPGMTDSVLAILSSIMNLKPALSQSNNRTQ
jgi:cellulose synthase (UDP-forming)